MKERGTVDLIVRDREMGNALVAASTEASEGYALLSGKLVLLAQGGVTEAPITLEISNDRDIKEIKKGSTLYFTNENGDAVGPEVQNYSAEPAIGDRYRVYSGEASEDDGRRIDFVAASDPVEIALAAILGGICLVRSLAELYIVKETIDAYKEQGYRPQLMMESRLTGMLTCSFVVEIRAIDSKDEVVEKKEVKFGRKKRD
jgi:hypothetical protein